VEVGVVEEVVEVGVVLVVEVGVVAVVAGVVEVVPADPEVAIEDVPAPVVVVKLGHVKLTAATHPELQYVSLVAEFEHHEQAWVVFCLQVVQSAKLGQTLLVLQLVIVFPFPVHKVVAVHPSKALPADLSAPCTTSSVGVTSTAGRISSTALVS